MEQQLKPQDVDIVIYHNPCNDGFGSRYCAEKYFRTNFPNKQVEYVPMSIGIPPPDNLEGKNVLICDYSYRKDILLELLKKVKNLLIIDHHKSAEKDLKDIDDKHKIFDMKHSGAMLTYYYFFPNQPVPLLIQYIEDRDIWTKKLPNNDHFSSWFHTLDFDYDIYDKYGSDDALLKTMIDTYGKSYSELNDYYVKQACTYVVPKFQRIKDKYYFVGYVNTTVLKSDIGNKIFDTFKHLDFSAVYSINESSDSTSFSLRSTDVHMDVSEVAFSLGGGGHRNASGVNVQYVCNRLPGPVFDNGKLYENICKIYVDDLAINNLTINNELLSVIYLFSSVHKFRLGTYLLQTKYMENRDTNDNNTVNTDKRPVQECCDIIRQRDNVKEYFNSHIACVLDYNPIDDETYYTFVFDKKISKTQIEAVNNFFNLDVTQGMKFTGFHKVLPIDMIFKGLIKAMPKKEVEE